MKLAVLGCGNLATAVVSKLEGLEIHTYTPSFIKAEELAQLKGGTAHKELSQVPKCDFVMLGMKPQQFSEFSEIFRDIFHKDSVIISLLAGTDVKTISTKLGGDKIARVMSNTPALIGEGVHGIYFHNVDQQQFVVDMLKSSGEVITLESEKEIDAITHFSGSGPAYLFDLARILTNELEKRGISHDKAVLAIKQTLKGSAALLSESPLDAIELRKQVTSKAGITEKVLESLWDSNIEDVWDKALVAGDKRIAELKG